MPRRSFGHRFGLVLRRERIRKKLTQEALAEHAGIHPSHLSLIERGRRSPTLDVAWSLAGALGIPLSKLITDAGVLDEKE